MKPTFKFIRENDTSFKRLVLDSRYDRDNDRLRTPEEMVEQKRWVDELLNSFTDTKSK